MAADSSGDLFILYDMITPFSPFPDTAWTALGEARHTGGSWYKTVLATPPLWVPLPFIDHRSIGIDRFDHPHIVYSVYKIVSGIPGWSWDLYHHPGAIVDEYNGRCGSVATDSEGHDHISYGFPGLWYATNASGEWQSERITAVESNPLFTSVAVDPLDRVHIAYNTASEDNVGYVTNASGDWVNEVVDAEGLYGGYVDGSHASLALDGEAHAHISYYDATNGDLKYATNAGGAWTAEAVDTEGTVGLYASLALGPSGTVHVAYLDETNRRLKYATRQGDGWRLETACDRFFGSGQGTSLVVLDTGTVHISHSGYDGTLLFTSGTPCTDRDGDGHGDPANAACAHPEADCDDSRPDVNPGTTEICTNGIDDECDGLADEADPECEAPPAWGVTGETAASTLGESPPREGSSQWNLLAALLVPMIAIAACLRRRGRKARSSSHG